MGKKIGEGWDSQINKYKLEVSAHNKTLFARKNLPFRLLWMILSSSHHLEHSSIHHYPRSCLSKPLMKTKIRGFMFFTNSPPTWSRKTLLFYLFTFIASGFSDTWFAGIIDHRRRFWCVAIDILHGIFSTNSIIYSDVQVLLH